jgi:hypothetical protein
MTPRIRSSPGLTLSMLALACVVNGTAGADGVAREPIVFSANCDGASKISEGSESLTTELRFGDGDVHLIC